MATTKPHHRCWVHDVDISDVFDAPTIPHAIGRVTRLMRWTPDRGRGFGEPITTHEGMEQEMARVVATDPQGVAFDELCEVDDHLGDVCVITRAYADPICNTFQVTFADGCMLYAIAADLELD